MDDDFHIGDAGCTIKTSKGGLSSKLVLDLDRRLTTYRGIHFCDTFSWYIIEQYRTCVPEAQQACITLWGISDHPDEHVYWIPNDAPNLLDANYARKPAYKGVCDGIAGRDISEDFSGDDWKDAYGTKGE